MSGQLITGAFSVTVLSGCIVIYDTRSKVSYNSAETVGLQSFNEKDHNNSVSSTAQNQQSKKDGSSTVDFVQSKLEPDSMYKVLVNFP